MSNAQRVRKTAVLTLVLASVLFAAGAGPAAALDHRHDGDFGANVVVNLLERIGNFVSSLAVEVVDIFTKETHEQTPDG